MVKIAHLGPAGTYAEAATLAYDRWRRSHHFPPSDLQPYASIPQTLQALAAGTVDLAVVPVENSIEGGVTTTLDTLWQLDELQLQEALVLPIQHALITSTPLAQLEQIYSHPQALAQCQQWLEDHVPQAQRIPANSTAEALHDLTDQPTAAAIASPRAAELYNLPIAAFPINDRPDNCTKFWVFGQKDTAIAIPPGSHTALAYSLPKNVPGALVKTLQLFAAHDINLSRIESRPTKRSLGEYLFFVDLEAGVQDERVQATLGDLDAHTETLKVFGSYNTIDLEVVTQLLQPKG